MYLIDTLITIYYLRDFWFDVILYISGYLNSSEKHIKTVLSAVLILNIQHLDQIQIRS